MKYPLVSIIIPVYNVADFLSQCIESVLVQTYSAIELLLIDDGSTDGSKEICDSYLRKDERVRVIHKENTGVSDSRNRGLKAAKGKYLMFFDADDFWVDNLVLEKLVSLAEEYDLDILRGEYEVINEKNEFLYSGPFKDQRKSYSYSLLDSTEFLERILRNEFFLWLSLIRRDSVGMIEFNTNRIFLEDAEFYLTLLQKDLRCMYIPYVFYLYRKHDMATTVKKNPQKLGDAFSFSRFCIKESRNAKGKIMKSLLLKIGINNYLYDIEAIATDEDCFCFRRQIFKQWNVFLLAENISRITKGVNITRKKYIFCKLPLSIQVFYFRIKHVYKMIKLK